MIIDVANGKPAISTEMSGPFFCEGPMAITYDYRLCSCGAVYSVMLDKNGQPMEARAACSKCLPPRNVNPWLRKRQALAIMHRRRQLTT
jgi:hypothetical protein